MQPVDYRPLRRSDDERVVDVLLASRALDGPSDPISRAQLRHFWFDFPGLDLERDTIAATGSDGLVVGFAAAFPRERPKRAARAFVPGPCIRPTAGQESARSCSESLRRGRASSWL